ncbi:CU044_5270 family protein [Micromonospora sp. URMC 103]|uniref:CU044_5270 family protein n=1 Tax=Micromonospora sp. URMC 103 TaxID=3423406 RepID=UPI003F1BDEDC
MPTQQQVRALLGPADPARGATVPPAPAAARELILRAEREAQPEQTPIRRVASRRTVLVGGAAVATAVASAGLVAALRDRRAPEVPATPQPGEGIVLRPVAYELTTDAEQAGPHLRALAAHLVAAPYDGAGGRYDHHRVRSWGNMVQESPEGHVASYVEERRSWVTRDGRRWSDQQTLDIEFPDAASREYWTKQLASAGGPRPGATSSPGGLVEEPPGQEIRRLPTDRAALARALRSDLPAGDMARVVYDTYVRYLIPRRARADILTILADKPGFVFRGRVVDRAGRRGVGVTADLTPPTQDPQRAQMLLVFEPSTGELLAHEYLELAPQRRVLYYGLVLEAGRTDRLG